MITGQRWDRIWRAFDDAIVMPPEERLEHLRARCGDDGRLVEEVRSLLTAHERAEATPAFEPSSGWWLASGPSPQQEPSLEGRRIGRYLVGRHVGSGSSGSVFEAWQQEPRKRVALKVLRAGVGDERSVRRFEFEAEILARLHHPGVAQVYECGSFDLLGVKQPYLVMEFVEGPSLTAFARAADLGRASRIDLLIAVCEAVHHVHQRGVVHRDLKPGNVLVDQQGDAPQVKVLDFGVARLVAPDAIATASHSFESLAGTLPYMSPEQLRGDAATVDIQTDVYSLGVIAYELLAGTLPFPLPVRSFLEAVERIISAAPVRLGDRDHSLRGDLETVVHAALAREPKRRYQTASDFAADLRRVTRCEPIAARAPTRIYLLDRFVRRNRVLVGGVAATAAALVLGTAVAGWMALQATRAEARATERFQQVRGLAKSVIFDLEPAIAALPGSTPVRRQLVELGLHHLDALYQGAGDDPILLDELADGYERLANVQGHPKTPNLGDHAGAVASFGRALELRGRLADLSGASTDRVRLARCRTGLATTLAWQGRRDDALRLYDQTREDMLALGRRDGGDFAAMAQYFGACETIVSAHREAIAEADIAALRARVADAWRDAESTWRKSPVTARDRNQRGVALMLGAMMHVDVDELDAALRRLDEAAPLLAAAAAELPDEVGPTLDHADVFRHLGSIHLRRASWHAATEAYQHAIDIYEDALSRFPDSSSVQHIVSVTRILLADALAPRDGPAAIAEARRAVNHVEEWMGQDPRNILRRQLAVHVLEQTGAMLQRLATQEGAGRSRADETLALARAWLTRARSVALRTIDEGAGSIVEHEAVPRLTGRIAECDGALSRGVNESE